MKQELVDIVDRTVKEWQCGDIQTVSDAIYKCATRVADLYDRPPVMLTDVEINRAVNGMPCGPEGFLKGWGWQQFARAIEAAVHAKQKAPVEIPLDCKEWQTGNWQAYLDGEPVSHINSVDTYTMRAK